MTLHPFPAPGSKAELDLRLAHCKRMLAESYHGFAKAYWQREVEECERDLELMAVVPAEGR